eukprot:jgi/Bigna1/90232/estExt_fgenesh1_pg.C_650098
MENRSNVGSLLEQEGDVKRYGLMPSAPALEDTELEMLQPLARQEEVVTAEPVAVVDGVLADKHGLIIRQRFYWSQVLFGFCERKTQFKVGAWTPDMPREMRDEHFLAQPLAMEVHEDSSCCCRYTLHSTRELKLGVFPPTNGRNPGLRFSEGWPQDQDPMLLMYRPFRCSVPCCCYMPWPQELILFDGTTQETRGRVVQDWRWWNCFWPCERFMNAYDERDNHILTIYTPFFCGGRNGCENCCAPTCFNHVHRSFVFRERGGQARTLDEARRANPDGYIEVHWPGWNARGLCLQNSGAENWVVKFPNHQESSSKEKVLTLGAWALSNFMFWETRKNQKR